MVAMQGPQWKKQNVRTLWILILLSLSVVVQVLIFAMRTGLIQIPEVNMVIMATGNEACSINNQTIQSLNQKLEYVEQRLAQSTTFLPLKDSRENLMMSGEGFMSSFKKKPVSGMPEELEFPSDLSKGRLLCLQGNHPTDGFKNSYGFAWREYMPENSSFLPGLTFVVGNSWPLVNLWHGMNALVSLVDWRLRNNCSIPDRWFLYQKGGLFPSLGHWLSNVASASMGMDLQPNVMQDEKNPVCLEQAVVHRSGIGGMNRARLNRLFDMVRCGSYKMCNLEMTKMNEEEGFNLTILDRTSTRAFKNISGVAAVVQAQCMKIKGCHLQIVYFDNLTFCEQVQTMSRTHILITPHGAQFTNAMFMPKGAAVLEFYPKGWLEYAGIGQRIYLWLTEWAGLNHEGFWHDPEGDECPYPKDRAHCFSFYKGKPIGLNETQLSDWTKDVLRRFRKKNIINDINGKTCSCHDFAGEPRQMHYA